MRMFLPVIVTLALALWLGGLASLFLFVQQLFAKDRGVAVASAPILFRAFEIYQLIVFAIAIVACVAWLWIGRSGWKAGVALLLLAAGALAIVQIALVSSRMRVMMDRNETGLQEFKDLHGYSMIIYSSEIGLLAAAAMMMPAAIRADAFGRRRELELAAPPASPRETSPGTAGA
jgi:hypothetical protein